jgi:ABC-type transporter Mla subunit MlaD
MNTPATEQRKRNLRLALILASVALVFLLGFVVKMLWLSGR